MKTWTKQIKETKFKKAKLRRLKAWYIKFHADRAFARGGSLGQGGSAKLSAKFDALVDAAEFKATMGINRNESII